MKLTQKISMNITETDARALEALTSPASGLGMTITAEDHKPFELRWDPHQRGDRFHLPCLYYAGERVAALGYRNKDGFVSVGEGLSEEVGRACASTFYRLAKLARQDSLRQKAERDQADAHLKTITDALPVVRTHETISQKAVSGPEMVAALSERFMRDPNMRVRSHGNAREGRVEVFYEPSTEGASTHFLSVIWTSSTPAYHPPRMLNVATNLMSASTACIFLMGCVNARRERMRKDTDIKRLESVVAETDMGYF